MNSFYTVFVVIVILLNMCSGVEKKRMKREPPVYHYKQYYGPPRQKPKPVYGPPPILHRPVYGPPKKPKPVYGPPPSVYTPPPPIHYTPPMYKPPQSYANPPVYGPPDYSPPSLNPPVYGPPNYSPPSNPHVYGPPSHSPPSNPPVYGPPSHSPPSTSYGVPIHFPSPPADDYGPPPSQQFSPPSTHYGHPANLHDFGSFDSQTTSFSHADHNFEIPPEFSRQPLTYDTSSSSYGTPGAINSYGVPVTQHEPPLRFSQPLPSYETNAHHRAEDIFANDHFISSFSDYRADSSDQYSKKIETKLKAPDPTVSYGKAETTSKVPNHNYDGPGVQDDDLEVLLKDRKKQKFTNFYKQFDDLPDDGEVQKKQKFRSFYKQFDDLPDDGEVQKSYSFDFYGEKSHSLVSPENSPTTY